MKRNKKKSHSETPGTSKSQKSGTKHQGLPTHDRVELLQTVFSLLKPPEVMKMTPKSMQKMPLSTVKELCLEELLGISTKRLCAVLDGTSIPSDTESSTSDSDLGGAAMLDAVSLESISSDEGDNGAVSSGVDIKPKHCKRRKNASKGKDKKKGKEKDKGKKDKTTPSNAEGAVGPTVLELLELQARARAIRAQLDNEHGKKKSATSHPAPDPVGHDDSDDDVEIKEEPQEVVELSSSDEDRKPDPAWLEKTVKNPEPKTSKATEESSQTVTRRNDFTIIVPKSQTTRKIKLNRQVSATVATLSCTPQDVNLSEKVPSPQKPNEEPIDNATQTSAVTSGTTTDTTKVTEETTQKKAKKKGKGKKKKKAVQEESDHDEISLQLSDTEKMDLLDDFRPRSRRVTSSSSADSETSSSSSDGPDSDDQGINTNTVVEPQANSEDQAKSNTSVPENEEADSAEKNEVNDTDVQKDKDDSAKEVQNKVVEHISAKNVVSIDNEKSPSKNEAVSENDNKDVLIEPKEVAKPGAENIENHGSITESTQDGDTMDSVSVVQDTNVTKIDVSGSEKADKSPISQEGEVEAQGGEKSGQGDDVTEKDGFAIEANTELQTATVKHKKTNKSKAKKKEKKLKKQKHKKN